MAEANKSWGAAGLLRLLNFEGRTTILEYFKHMLGRFWRGSAPTFSKLGALAPPSVAIEFAHGKKHFIGM